MGEEAIQYARTYALDAERRMGEMLTETKPKRAKGGQPYHEKMKSTPSKRKGVDTPTLKELGLTEKESHLAQKLAALPVEIFEQVKAGTKTRIKAMRQASKRHTRQRTAKIRRSHRVTA
jgi:hypothetical protein